jgi:hypothetical protein
MSAEVSRAYFASRIPYRTTSGAALGTSLVLTVWTWLPKSPPALPKHPGPGEWQFDLCTLSGQIGAIDRLAVSAGLVAFLVFLIQGLRNRTGPRPLALAGIAAIPWAVLGDWWRIRAGCYSLGGMICAFIWLGSVGLMFLHHAVQPHRKATAEYEQLSRFGRRCYDVLFPAFFAMTVVWAVLNQLRVMTYDGATVGAVNSAILVAQEYVKWAWFVLAPIAGGVALHWMVVRLRRIVRVEPNP